MQKAKGNWFYQLFQVFIRPYSAGAKLVEEKSIGPSLIAVLLHVLSSGTFIYLLVVKTDGLIQGLVAWIHDGAGRMLENLTETVTTFLQDTAIDRIGSIPLVGEAFQEPVRGLAEDRIPSLSADVQNLTDVFFHDLSDALRLPSFLSLGISVLFVLVLILLLAMLIWAMLKITKHKWCSFKGAFCLSAVRSTVTIPFAIVSALLVCVNPLLGIGLFALAIFWSMGHLYTTIMAGADTTSGNRSAAWFPPILILMYLLTAAVLIVIIVFAGITLYHQFADVADLYIDAITGLIAP